MGARLSLRVKLSGAAASCGLKVYSRAWVLMQSAEMAGGAPGWNELAWDRGELPAGTYYVQVKSHGRDGRGSDQKTVTMVVLR
jgi:hypothetical protein